MRYFVQTVNGYGPTPGKRRTWYAVRDTHECIKVATATDGEIALRICAMLNAGSPETVETKRGWQVCLDAANKNAQDARRALQVERDELRRTQVAYDALRADLIAITSNL